MGVHGGRRGGGQRGGRRGGRGERGSAVDYACVLCLWEVRTEGLGFRV
jgi:hypothetical protein